MTISYVSVTVRLCGKPCLPLVYFYLGPDMIDNPDDESLYV